MDNLNVAITTAVSEAKGEVAPEPTTPKEAPVQETAPEPAKPETPPEPEPTTAKVTPTAKVEPPAKPTPEPEPEEEFFNPTAEDLAIIENSPELKKAYRALRKGFTEKTTKLAEERKQLNERAELAAWIQQNPEKAARRLAELSGLSITEARAEVKEAKEAATAVTDELSEMWKKSIGDDAAPILRPVIEATARAVAEKLLAPYREKTEELDKASQRRAIAATVSEFGAGVTQRGDEWNEEIQAEMARLSDKVKPGDDTPIEEYLSEMYDSVMMKRTRTQTARANLNRLRRLKDEQEPVTPARPTPKSEDRVTVDMSDRDAVALAVRQAQKELGR